MNFAQSTRMSDQLLTLESRLRGPDESEASMEVWRNWRVTHSSLVQEEVK